MVQQTMMKFSELTLQHALMLSNQTKPKKKNFVCSLLGSQLMLPVIIFAGTDGENPVPKF